MLLKESSNLKKNYCLSYRSYETAAEIIIFLFFSSAIILVGIVLFYFVCYIVFAILWRTLALKMKWLVPTYYLAWIWGHCYFRRKRGRRGRRTTRTTGRPPRGRKKKKKKEKKEKKKKKKMRQWWRKSIPKIKWIDLTNPPLTFDPVKAKKEKKKPSGLENEKERNCPIFSLQLKIHYEMYRPTKRKLKLDFKRVVTTSTPPPIILRHRHSWYLNVIVRLKMTISV